MPFLAHNEFFNQSISLYIKKSINFVFKCKKRIHALQSYARLYPHHLTMSSNQLQRNTILFGAKGTYQIRDVIGQGGFGITYTAGATGDGMPESVAIKEFFPRDMCSRAPNGEDVVIDSVDKMGIINQLRTRFVKESQNIQNCDHPGIVKVLDTIEANGTAYMVMELVRGKTLKGYLSAYGALNSIEAARIILNVAYALRYLHNKKITHLDIKPDNIMISDDGTKITIIDFGLSRQFNDDGTSDSQIITAVSKGYAAPEMYLGSNQFSPESDVYSMGATLYKLVTGTTPPEPYALTDNMSALKFGSTVTPQIRRVVLASMTQDKKQRLKTTTDFIMMLNGKKPLPPVPPPPVPRPKKRGGMPAVILNILFLGLMVLAGFLVYDEWKFKWHKFNNFFQQDHVEYIMSMYGVCFMSFIGLVSRGRVFKTVIFILALLGFGLVFLNSL